MYSDSQTWSKSVQKKETQPQLFTASSLATWMDSMPSQTLLWQNVIQVSLLGKLTTEVQSASGGSLAYPEVAVQDKLLRHPLF